MAYVPSDGLPWRRSCVILYQACTWAPKRNQVFSESLISRDGPSWAKAGTGDVGGGFSAGSFSVCDCAEAAPAIPQTRTASAARWMKSLLLFEALPMSSSSLIGCGGRSPSRARDACHVLNIALRSQPVRESGSAERNGSAVRPHRGPANVLLANSAILSNASLVMSNVGICRKA